MTSIQDNPRRAARALQTNVVTIREVNADKRFIVGMDQYAGLIQIAWFFQDGAVSVPKVGERWTIYRRGIDWILGERRDTGAEQLPLASLSPGDRRLDAPGLAHISGDVGTHVTGPNIKIGKGTFDPSLDISNGTSTPTTRAIAAITARKTNKPGLFQDPIGEVPQPILGDATLIGRTPNAEQKVTSDPTPLDSSDIPSGEVESDQSTVVIDSDGLVVATETADFVSTESKFDGDTLAIHNDATIIDGSSTSITGDEFDLNSGTVTINSSIDTDVMSDGTLALGSSSEIDVLSDGDFNLSVLGLASLYAQGELDLSSDGTIMVMGELTDITGDLLVEGTSTFLGPVVMDKLSVNNLTVKKTTILNGTSTAINTTTFTVTSSTSNFTSGPVIVGTGANNIEFRHDDNALGFWIRNDGQSVISTKSGDMWYGYAGRPGLIHRFGNTTFPTLLIDNDGSWPGQLRWFGDTYLRRWGVSTLETGKFRVIGSGGQSVDLVVNGRIQSGDETNNGGIWYYNPVGSGFSGMVGNAVGFYNNGWQFYVDPNGYVSIPNRLDILQLRTQSGPRRFLASTFGTNTWEKSTLDIQGPSGTLIGTTDTLKFVNASVTSGGGIITVTMPGTNLSLMDHGVSLGFTDTLNFTGVGVSAAIPGGVGTITLTPQIVVNGSGGITNVNFSSNTSVGISGGTATIAPQVSVWNGGSNVGNFTVLDFNTNLTVSNAGGGRAIINASGGGGGGGATVGSTGAALGAQAGGKIGWLSGIGAVVISDGGHWWSTPQFCGVYPGGYIDGQADSWLAAGFVPEMMIWFSVDSSSGMVWACNAIFTVGSGAKTSIGVSSGTNSGPGTFGNRSWAQIAGVSGAYNLGGQVTFGGGTFNVTSFVAGLRWRYPAS